MNAPPTPRTNVPIRRALITGSSSGIGEATARRLAASGFAVAVHGRQEQNVRKIVADIESSGGKAVSIIGDLAKDGMPATVAEQASVALGGLDLVVNNAAMLLFGGLEETSLAEIRQVFEVNLFAVTAVINAVLPQMRERGYGRIINVSSVVGWLPFPFMGTYSMTKHAMEGYSETLDHEVREFGIRVSTVQPGYTQTNIHMNSNIVAQTNPQYDSTRARIRDLIEERILHGTHPDRVARVIVRAALDRSPRPRYIVGLGPKTLRILRSIVPSGLFSAAFRRQFLLE